MRTALGAALASCLALGVAMSGCTVLVDPEAAQCASDRDCVRFPGTVCQAGGCIPRDASADTSIDAGDLPCTSTQDCEAFHPTRYWVCRSSRCVALASNDCGTVIGDYTADDVLLLGAILPIFGAHKSSGIAMERALAFAADEDFMSGVPFGQGGATHPVALVLCDESADPVRAATHLANDVKVAAIVGPTRGEALLRVAKQVAGPAGVLLFSPTAVADLSSVTPGGLVWRTAPLGAVEGAAMSALVASDLEARIRAVTNAPIAVAVVAKDDDDARAIQSGLASLRINGAPADSAANAAYFRSISYGNPDDAGKDAMTSAVASVLQMPTPPDLVIVVGETEAVTGILAAIEEEWGHQIVGKAPPLYLVSHGLQTAELLARADLAGRVLTTVPGGDAHTNASLLDLYVRYRALYKDYPVETFGVAQTYDAFYMLAYGLAAVRNVDVIGRDVRDGLMKVLAPPGDAPIAVGPKGIVAAYGEIRNGKSLALSGAASTGPYAFDFASGTAPSDVQTWCLAQAVPPVFAAAGAVYRAATGALDGAISATCFK